jgi:hypothetical protein
MLRSLRTLSLAFALTGLMISPAAAETSEEEENARHEAARVAGEAGLKLYSATRWQEAFEAFQRAESAFHAPTLVLYMAHCQRMRGKLIDARTLYQQVVSEALGPGAPNQFLTAQLLARGELDRIRRRISGVVLTIKGASADRVRITVDGAPLPTSTGTPQDLDPGEHTLTATAPGAAPIQRTITLTEGATTELELAFQAPSGPTANTDAIQPLDPSRPSTASGSPLPSSSTELQSPHPSVFQGIPRSAWVAFSVGAAGIGVGTVTGVVALNQASDIKAICAPLRRCPASERARVDTAGRTADASTIGLLLGGAGVATGVVLWLVLPPGGAAHPGEASPVSLDVGPGTMILKGTF